MGLFLKRMTVGLLTVAALTLWVWMTWKSLNHIDHTEPCRWVSVAKIWAYGHLIPAVLWLIYGFGLIILSLWEEGKK